MTTGLRFVIQVLVTSTMTIQVAMASESGRTNNEFAEYIRFYEQELNGNDIQLRVLENEASEEDIFQELKILENAVFGGAIVPAGSLHHLACGRPECGGPSCPACAR